jgi:hypothetical protein
MQTVKVRRKDNFRLLADEFNSVNYIAPSIDTDKTPLCYPLMLNKSNVAKIKATLIQNKIYVPTYWPEVLMRVETQSFEYRLVNDCLALPCDHRYGSNEMHHIIKCLKTIL